MKRCTASLGQTQAICQASAGTDCYCDRQAAIFGAMNDHIKAHNNGELPGRGNATVTLENEVMVCDVCEREKRLTRRHCATCVCGCTCGYGGQHEPGNENCELNKRG